MNSEQLSVRITLWVNRIIALGVVVLCFALPSLLGWYRTVRTLTPEESMAITVAFYCCAVVAETALWHTEKLMSNILSGSVFVKNNVDRLRILRWCCLGVSLICIPAALVYYPLVFMVVIMGFLSLVVNVLCQVMKSAVAIREENDLTV